MRILLDTNVLLRLAKPTSVHYPLARSSVIWLVTANHELCVVPQVIYEFWSAATRPSHVNGLGMTAQQAEKSITELLVDVLLLKDERGIYAIWQTLVVRHSVSGKTSHDARRVAAMLRHDLSHILTFNGADFVRFGDLVVLSPAEILAGKLSS